MPIRKGMKPHERKTEATKDVKPRLAIVEEIMILTAPKWDAKSKKFKKAMTIPEACEKVGISDMTFRNWRRDDAKIGDYVDNLREARKEMTHQMMNEYALGNVMEIVSGSVKVRPMDKVNVSLRYLEKTDASFNPSVKLDVETTVNPAMSMSKEEIQQRILELSANLIPNNSTNEGSTSNTSPVPSTPTEESVGDGETPKE